MRGTGYRSRTSTRRDACPPPTLNRASVPNGSEPSAAHLEREPRREPPPQDLPGRLGGACSSRAADCPRISHTLGQMISAKTRPSRSLSHPPSHPPAWRCHTQQLRPTYGPRPPRLTRLRHPTPRPFQSATSSREQSH